MRYFSYIILFIGLLIQQSALANEFRKPFKECRGLRHSDKSLIRKISRYPESMSHIPNHISLMNVKTLAPILKQMDKEASGFAKVLGSLQHLIQRCGNGYGLKEILINRYQVFLSVRRDTIKLFELLESSRVFRHNEQQGKKLLKRINTQVKKLPKLSS